METIERYYNHSMSNEERIEFETKLNHDPQFKSEVEEVQSLFHTIETQSLKEKLEEFHKELPQEMEPNQPSHKIRFLHYKQIAVAAILVIGAACFWFFTGTPTDRLFDEYFKPDPGLPTTMSTSDNFVFYDAMVNYKQEDYKTAIKKWEKLELKDPNNDTLTYFLGVANLANKNASEAITYLNKTVEISNSVFIEDAYYYLGMAYLKKENFALAKKNLNKSAMQEAKNILSKIKE